MRRAPTVPLGPCLIFLADGLEVRPFVAWKSCEGPGPGPGFAGSSFSSAPIVTRARPAGQPDPRCPRHVVGHHPGTFVEQRARYLGSKSSAGQPTPVPPGEGCSTHAGLSRSSAAATKSLGRRGWTRPDTSTAPARPPLRPRLDARLEQALLPSWTIHLVSGPPQAPPFPRTRGALRPGPLPRSSRDLGATTRTDLVGDLVGAEAHRGGPPLFFRSAPDLVSAFCAGSRGRLSASRASRFLSTTLNPLWGHPPGRCRATPGESMGVAVFFNGRAAANRGPRLSSTILVAEQSLCLETGPPSPCATRLAELPTDGQGRPRTLGRPASGGQAARPFTRPICTPGPAARWAPLPPGRRPSGRNSAVGWCSAGSKQTRAPAPQPRKIIAQEGGQADEDRTTPTRSFLGVAPVVPRSRGQPRLAGQENAWTAG